MNIDQWKTSLSGDKSFEALLTQALEDAGDNVQKYMKPCKKGYMLALAKPDPERELLENHVDEKVRLLMEGRLALEAWPKHIQRVERLVRMARCNGDLLPIPLKYCGAHTGRWSGDEKINPQNMGSKGHKLANAVREIIIAREGQILAITDASAIEARVLAWIAGQWDLVEKFERNEEIYCGFASKVLGYAVRKPKKSGGIPAIEQRMGWARNSIGKVGILGCGYGMGATKAEGYAQGAIDFATAEKIVATYRQENKAIVQFWTDIEKAFAYAFRYRQSCSLPRGLSFSSRDDCDVIITLPNGRELKYHNVKIERGGKFNQETIKIYNDQEHKWEHTWGGSLTENVVQAMSRDVLDEAFLRLEDRGYHTAMHIHDEVVCPVPEDQGEDCLAASIEQLSRVPEWAPRMPLAAEGKLSKCYAK